MRDKSIAPQSTQRARSDPRVHEPYRTGQASCFLVFQGVRLPRREGLASNADVQQGAITLPEKTKKKMLEGPHTLGAARGTLWSPWSLRFDRLLVEDPCF